jgi:hypothetical protein
MYRDELEQENANLRRTIGEMKELIEQRKANDLTRRKRLLKLQGLVQAACSVFLYMIGTAMYCGDSHATPSNFGECVQVPHWFGVGTLVALNIAVGAIVTLAKALD